MPMEQTPASAGVGPAAWRVLAATQGIYFALTGVWPVVHIPSFMLVTGPKTDLWLVRLVGAMITVVGVILLDAARRGRLDRGVWGLGFWMPVVLGTVDVVYVINQTIPPVYLLDAVAEAAIAAWWLGVLAAKRKRGAG